MRQIGLVFCDQWFFYKHQTGGHSKLCYIINTMDQGVLLTSVVQTLVPRAILVRSKSPLGDLKTKLRTTKKDSWDYLSYHAT